MVAAYQKSVFNITRLPGSQMETEKLSVFFRTILLVVLCMRFATPNAIPSDQAQDTEAERARNPPQELFFRIFHPDQADRPAVLECKRQSVATVEYKWTKNGQAYPVSGIDDRVAQDPSSGTLTIHRPKDSDEGMFQCWAGVSTSNTIHLRRARLDSFQGGDTPEELYVQEGKPLTIKCHPPTGVPRPHAFWILQYPDGAMQTVQSSRIAVDPEGDLHFSNVTLEDASGNNTYACSVYSPFLNEYKTGSLKKLIVLPSGSAIQNTVPPVRQYTSPANVTGMLGQSIEFSCIYGGTPLPEIRWVRREAPLQPTRLTLANFGKVFRINDLEFEDRGTYGCYASNGLGQRASQAFRLHIESIPEK